MSLRISIFFCPSHYRFCLRPCSENLHVFATAKRREVPKTDKKDPQRPGVHRTAAADKPNVRKQGQSAHSTAIEIDADGQRNKQNRKENVFCKNRF